jgi:phytoene dehydrogenase-like protein
MPRHQFDVIVVGGGHNGLVAAGLLAKRGRRVVVLERRPVVGGAAVTETPWGPDFKVTALSYVVSLLPPLVVRELELERHGYKVYPQNPYFVAYPDGRYLILADDKARRHAEIGRFSARDADAMERWDAWLEPLAHTLGLLLGTVPPKIGAKGAGDLLEQARLAWRLRGLDVTRIGDLTRLMTMSIADLLEERFESPELRGLLAVSGVIGTWAGPRSPGTAYVMAHHKIGEHTGAWGFPEGGMGAVAQAMRRAAESLGATVVTGARVARIAVRDGHVEGVDLDDGDGYRAGVVVTTVHPRIAFLELIEARELPAAFVDDIARWKSRSGTVKINLALDRLPEFRAKPGFDPEVHGGTIVLADSLDELEAAFQDAVAGRPARRPFADICIPSVFDRTLAPPGKHVMSLFTQWVPHTFVAAPHRDELDAYAERVVDRLEELAPGFRSSILHRQIIGPHEMERDYGLVGGNIFHGELSASQIFHMRPAPGFADFRTPIAGLYQAGSATHGGGGVTALPALQAVRQIAADGY